MVGWRVALWAVIMVAALTFLYLVRSILLPFVLALLLSILLDPAVRKLRLRGMSRGGAVAAVMLTFLLVGVGALAIIGPQMWRQVGSLANRISEQAAVLTAESEHSNFFVSWNPRYRVETQSPTDGLDIWLKGHSKMLQPLGLPGSVDQFVSQYVDPHKDEIAKAAETYFGTFLGFMTGFGSKLLLILFTPIFTWFILSDLDRFKRGTTAMIPPSIRKDVLGLLDDIGEVFGRYLRGIATVLIYYSILATIVLTLLGAPYAILLALLFAVIYLIPMLGPVINVAILVLVTVVSGRSSTFFPAIQMSSPLIFGLTIAAIYFAIMTLFDQLVYARIVGKSVGLHPVVSFFVIFSGATLFGAIGMILAFPVAGSIKVILDRMLRFTSKDLAEDGLHLPATPMRHKSPVQG